MSSPQFWSNAPSAGAYKEHEVAEVFKPAGYASLFFNLAAKKRVMSGEGLTVPAYENLDRPNSLLLDEDQPIPLSKLTVSAKTISMNERGRAVAITGKTARRSPFDILEAHKKAIATMMEQELEVVISTALKSMPVKYVANGAAAQNITVNGTPGAGATHNPNIYHMQYVSDYMQDQLRIPFDPRFGSYVGVFRGNGILSIQQDDDFVKYHEGTGLTAIQKCNVGKIADITFMKHNNSDVLDRALGSSNNVSEGFILGDQAVLFGFLEQIGLHYDFSKSKATDFGRFKYIAWMGDYGAGLYSDSANADLVRGIHWTSNV